MNGEDWSWARFVNWPELFADAPDPEIDWLAEPFLEKGTSVSVYSDVKAGKSLLLQEIAARLASGLSVLASPARAPVSVLYLDFENNASLLRERYRDKMGYAAEALRLLNYASYPALPPMDTPAGGQAAWRMASACSAGLVIIDTTSRIIAGAENSADTLADLYKHTLMPLKREGVTVVRLDHEGKDESRGQRGTSAKGADVDVVWHLTQGPKDQLTLHPDYDRLRHSEAFRLMRLDAPLRHELVTEVLSQAANGLAIALDQLRVPDGAPRNTCRDALRAAGITGRTEDLAAAVRWRKTGRKPAPAPHQGGGTEDWQAAWDMSKKLPQKKPRS